MFYNGATQTGCGAASAQTGPFYCPADGLVYFDLDFLQQLQSQFGAQGDFATAYITADEYGHHVQNLLGLSRQVSEATQQQPSRGNELSIRLELQADCYAGVWGASVQDQLDRGDLEEGLNAAAAVGDDRIQLATQGRTDPESWNHGRLRATACAGSGPASTPPIRTCATRSRAARRSSPSPDRQGPRHPLPAQDAAGSSTWSPSINGSRWRWRSQRTSSITPLTPRAMPKATRKATAWLSANVLPPTYPSSEA